MTDRKKALNHWITTVAGTSDFVIEPASEDASFRSYFRLKVNQRSFIVMDAPPEHENCEPFLHVQKLLASHRVNVPIIHAFDPKQGFMLLSDFGSVLYLDILFDGEVEKLYSLAIDEMLLIQSVNDFDGIPPYDKELLTSELALFSDWFIGRHLGTQLTEQQQYTLLEVNQLLIENALSQPQVLVHRDYHSRNIMLTVEGKPGIIDFQDAVVGPITYDLASLLKDCYISWPTATIHGFIKQFITKHNSQHALKLDFEEYLRWFDLMAAQRHMKAIGIFCRLNYRDGKKQYLYDIPRTMNYLTDTCQKYAELNKFGELLSEIQPKIIPLS
jgi:aminoglycoside/choline kinase family phosphotransferase